MPEGLLQGSEPMDISILQELRVLPFSVWKDTWHCCHGPQDGFLWGFFFPQRFVELLLPEVGICLVCEVCVRMLMSVREGSSVAFLVVCTCGLRCLELINITIVKMKSSC